MVRCKVLIDWDYEPWPYSGETASVLVYIYTNHIGRAFILNGANDTLVQIKGFGIFVPDVNEKVYRLKKRKKANKSGGYMYLNPLAEKLYTISNSPVSRLVEIDKSPFHTMLRYEYFMEKVFIYGKFKKRFNERKQRAKERDAQGKDKT